MCACNELVKQDRSGGWGGLAGPPWQSIIFMDHEGMAPGWMGLLESRWAESERAEEAVAVASAMGRSGWRGAHDGCRRCTHRRAHTVRHTVPFCHRVDSRGWDAAWVPAWVVVTGAVAVAMTAKQQAVLPPLQRGVVRLLASDECCCVNCEGESCWRAERRVSVTDSVDKRAMGWRARARSRGITVADRPSLVGDPTELTISSIISARLRVCVPC